MNELNGKVITRVDIDGNTITFRTNEGKYVYKAVAAFGREAVIENIQNTHILINRKVRNITGGGWNSVLWTNQGSAEFSCRGEWGYEAWFQLVEAESPRFD